MASVPPLISPAAAISRFLYLGLPSNGQPAGQPPDLAIEDYLRWLRDTDTFGGLTPPSAGQGNLIYHNVLPVSTPRNQRWTGDTAKIPGVISYSMLGSSSAYGLGRQSVSHELCHNLGFYHDVDETLFGPAPPSRVAFGAATPPEVGPSWYTNPLFEPFTGYPHGAPTLGPLTMGDNSIIYGLDTATLRNAPAMEPVLACTDTGLANCYFDLMSYCRDQGSLDEDAWPSRVTYASLLSSNNTYFGSSPVRLPQARVHGLTPPPPGHGPVPRDLGQDYLLVGATVDFNAGTAQFRPCLPLTTTNTPPGEAPGTNFLVEALNDSGTVLQTSQFTLAPNVFAENSTNQTASFIVALDADAANRTLRLWYNGSLMATLVASPHAPTLSLLTPNGGQQFGAGPVNIAWSASDADGDTLAYTVQYSADDGATWKTLAVHATDQTLGINSSQLAATTQGLMRVIASDGLNTTTAQSSNNFIVLPHAPLVSIRAPMDGSTFIGDQQLFLDAVAYDVQDGALGGTNVQWHSDRDGELGAGPVLTFASRLLSEGYHTITVTATDSAGLTNSAVTHLQELHYPPPQLEIQSTPALTDFLGDYYPAYATLTWPWYYTNYVLQTSGNLAAGWATMTNPAPQVNGYGQAVNVGVSNACLFFRLALQP